MENEIKYGPILKFNISYLKSGDIKHGHNFIDVIDERVDRLNRDIFPSDFPNHRVSHHLIEDNEVDSGLDVYLILVRKEK